MKKVLFFALVLLASHKGRSQSGQAQPPVYPASPTLTGSLTSTGSPSLTGPDKSPVLTGTPDSVFLFSYATPKDKGHSGLHFAWSTDKKTWNLIGNEYGYVKSDYGEWGSQKQMNSPYLFQDAAGQWRCVWSLNESLDQFACAASPDLIDWGRQRYPYLKQNQSFRQPVVHYNKTTREYLIAFISGDQYLRTTTKDFKVFTPAVSVPVSQYTDDRITVNLLAGSLRGNVAKVPRQVVERLDQFSQEKQHKADQAREESPKNDSTRFAGIKSLTATVTLKPESRKPISSSLIGVFFEDINYAADGGLYAELLQNRDFEYTPGDRKYHDSTWNSKYSWTAKGLGFTIDSAAPLHPNNPHYAVLDATSSKGALINSGYDGIPLKKGDEYAFSVFARNPNEKSTGLLVKLVAQDGSILAQAALNIDAQQWQKYPVTLTAAADASNASLELQMSTGGRLMLDMVSLFPKKTFKGRSNGMRADLAEAIAAIHPRFIRFPGGCVTHGDGLDNIYRWKNTVGPIEARKPQPNIWRYHQSVGLGFFEYFQYCEDIGAEPLPVIAAGVPCQNSSLTAKGGGQQGGIPMSEMGQYVQDILDLVEWANGPATSKWGKLRAESGHPAPFHLKYIGIGNEDLISDIFEERFTMIYKAIRQKHPEITVIGTVGPFYTGTDYEQGWDLAGRLKVPMVDEHYYESPGWFINNQDFYDHYDRTKPKVYLGEYASWGNTLFNALSEALYLTSLERNGDVVQMASYAPLLAREKHTQWNPDLIYFSNTEVRPTVNYEVQKLFGNNAGNEYLPTTIQLSVPSTDHSPTSPTGQSSVPSTEQFSAPSKGQVTAPSTSPGGDQAVRKRLGVSVVRDTTNDVIIIKLVNLLPIPTTVKLDLGDLTKGRQAERSVLHGLPDDKAAPVTVTATLPADQVLNETLPPYSLTVWKIHR